MIVKLLTEHHFKLLNLTGGCRGSSESKLVKMSNCWKSHAVACLLTEVAVSHPNKITFVQFTFRTAVDFTMGTIEAWQTITLVD